MTPFLRGRLHMITVGCVSAPFSCAYWSCFKDAALQLEYRLQTGMSLQLKRVLVRSFQCCSNKVETSLIAVRTGDGLPVQVHLVLRQLVLLREVADVGQLREGGAQVRRAGLVPARELREHRERAARAADVGV